MGSRSLDALVEMLRNSAFRDDSVTPSDEELLECYVSRQDDAAFAYLVRRHSQLVYGVCRRVLGNQQDAEDAFQAAFLILARKARSVRNGKRLGSWLYGVAYRTALHARSLRARRRSREISMPDKVTAVAAPPAEVDDLMPFLDEALNDLPEHYRVAVILCELQGWSRKAAANRLGIVEGTLSSRLAKARQLLARRLARHAPAAPVAVVGGLLTQSASASCVPPSLLATASNIPHSSTAEVVALAEGVLRMMLLSKIKTVALGSMIVSLLVWAGVLLGNGPLAGNESTVIHPKENPAIALPVNQPTPKQEKAGSEPAPKKDQSDQGRLQGIWRVVEATYDGNSLTEAQLKDMRLTVRGNTMLWDINDETVTPNKFTLAPLKTPKHIGITGQNAAGIRLSVAAGGVYKLDGEKLWICVADEAKAEPKGFASEKGSDILLCVLERDANASPDQVVVAKGPAEPVKISAIVPGSPPTLAQVNTGRFRVQFQLENTSKEPLILWPYLTLKVLDGDGQSVRLSRNLGRYGLRSGNNSILEDVQFVTLQPGATHTFDVSLFNYLWNSKAIQSWELKAPGTYTLELHYRYDRAEAKKEFGAGSKDIDNPKNPWNVAHELDRSMQIKVRVGDSAPKKEKRDVEKARPRERMFDVNGTITRIDKATEAEKKNRVLVTIAVKGSTVPVRITLDTELRIAKGKIEEDLIVGDLAVGDLVSIWFKDPIEEEERRAMPAERLIVFRRGEPGLPKGP
jgi:RNA polymerase sigma factor (sigma-70 family)